MNPSPRTGKPIFVIGTIVTGVGFFSLLLFSPLALAFSACSQTQGFPCFYFFMYLQVFILITGMATASIGLNRWLMAPRSINFIVAATVGLSLTALSLFAVDSSLFGYFFEQQTRGFPLPLLRGILLSGCSPCIAPIQPTDMLNALLDFVFWFLLSYLGISLLGYVGVRREVNKEGATALQTGQDSGHRVPPALDYMLAILLIDR